MRGILLVCAVAMICAIGYVTVTHRKETARLAMEVLADLNSVRAKLKGGHSQSLRIERELSGNLKNIERKMQRNSTAVEEHPIVPRKEPSIYSEGTIDLLTSRVADKLIEQYLTGRLPLSFSPVQEFLTPSRPKRQLDSAFGLSKGVLHIPSELTEQEMESPISLRITAPEEYNTAEMRAEKSKRPQSKMPKAKAPKTRSGGKRPAPRPGNRQPVAPSRPVPRPGPNQPPIPMDPIKGSPRPISLSAAEPKHSTALSANSALSTGPSAHSVHSTRPSTEPERAPSAAEDQKAPSKEFLQQLEEERESQLEETE
ncbi:hypothetical protein NEFER03_1712 [Nematocida sp. LUAm3]|nr:hypothetical protein NEFER03_1712 [Nematocida sp. LUAm3]KAI5175702.1 hypothetical protein NEFER02_1589 [Nematocida sp. LUAm2]KAI5178608.1 hypothetical protein NEFER01_1744 [Nematocida sp. LUAm1]